MLISTTGHFAIRQCKFFLVSALWRHGERQWSDKFLTFSSSITSFKLLPITTSANVLSSLENARNYHSYPHHIRKALTGNDDKISRVLSMLHEMILRTMDRIMDPQTTLLASTDIRIQGIHSQITNQKALMFIILINPHRTLTLRHLHQTSQRESFSSFLFFHWTHERGHQYPSRPPPSC